MGIGIVGIGFMGMIHYLAARKLNKGNVAAVCSRDRAKLVGDWTSIQGNFGPRGTQINLSGIATYTDIAALLDDPKVDLVDLCVPNDQHARLAIQALEAGKHVLVEKPIALTTADADAMLAVDKSSGRLWMVAHVVPFFTAFAFAAEAVRSGRHGAPRAAHLTRVISQPDWSRGVADADRSCGPAIDPHIHDTHFIGFPCGVPLAVQSRGVVDGGAVVHLTTQYLYDDPDLAISAVSGMLSHAGRLFLHGFEIFLERATLSFEFANLGEQEHVATPLSLILPDGTVQRPALGSSDPIDVFAAELGVAVSGAASGVAPLPLSGELARQALALCHAEVESVKSRKPITLG